MSVDVTNPIFYDSERSGTGNIISSYNIVSNVGDGDLDDFWDGEKWVLNSRVVLFKLFQPTIINSLYLDTFASVVWSVSLALVSSDDTQKILYAGGSGGWDPDISYDSGLWQFDDFEVDNIVFGNVAGGYPQELPDTILQIIASQAFPTGPGAFWTNHKGVTEL